jgi:hypothetical protein
MTFEETDLITPEQVRAGRGLLGWSQGHLARAARVGVSTVQDFEAGKRDALPNNTEALRRTLEKGGVTFIPANGEGPGVRLQRNRPSITRRPFQIAVNDTLGFIVVWRNMKALIEIPKRVFEILEGEEYSDLSEYLSAFRRNEQNILDITAKAIEEKRFSSPGFVELTISDFRLKR